MVATPGKLVNGMADALGIPRQSVVVIDRHLSEANLRSKGGRGRAAAIVNEHDATNLLIATAAGLVAKDAAQTVRKYGSLTTGDRIREDPEVVYGPELRGPKGAWALPGFDLPRLKALPGDHKFGDALAALIGSAADGSLEVAIEKMPEQDLGVYRLPPEWDIEIKIIGPHYPEARIYIKAEPYLEELHRYRPKEKISNLSRKEYREKYGDGDLGQVREFGEATIWALGNLLRGEPK